MQQPCQKLTSNKIFDMSINRWNWMSNKTRNGLCGPVPPTHYALSSCANSSSSPLCCSLVTHLSKNQLSLCRYLVFSSSRMATRDKYMGSPMGYLNDSDFSQASTSTGHSKIEQNKVQGTNSFRAAACEVAGAFVTCFAPRLSKTNKGGLQEGIIQADDASSTSTSNISTISSISHSKFMCSRSPNRTNTQETTKFSIPDIYKATGNFSIDNRIGQGGFGTVYKGKLKDGSLIAVKRAKKMMYGKHQSIEFKNEIQTLSKVEHLNLVRFLGCLEHADEQIIVVEYVSNGTLREHLDGLRGDGLELAERLDIAIDIAHAVTYLHTYTDHPIIHRDINSSNVLLTEKLRAKVADFGFAHLAAEDPDATHISTGIKGTAGYVDPEYIRTYQLTDKSDVYSFGVLLVELVTGRRPIERNRDHKERVTTRWAMQRYKAGDAVMAMDRMLRRSPAAITAVEKVMGLALHCLEPSRKSRPSMKKCAEVLWGIRKDFWDMQRSKS